MRIFFIVALIFITISCCAQKTNYVAHVERSDGILIPFSLTWLKEKGKNSWLIRNAAEQIIVSDVQIQGDSVIVHMPVFESEFRLVSHAGVLTGQWIKGGSVRNQVMAFTATPGNRRFNGAQAALNSLTGRWSVKFKDTFDSSVAEFNQTGNKLTGTFLNPTGDYRYQEGTVTGDSIFLSSFDGGHAFLFTAHIRNDHTLDYGKFYSGFKYKEDWSATRNSKASVSQASVAMAVKPGEDHLHFTFNNLDKQPVSISDLKFKNKVVIIQLMGSWCPNCMDETAFLSNYYNKNRSRGVEVIALAYEYSAEWARSEKSLRKFQQRFDVQYTILNTGITVSDTLRTQKTLPEVTDIKFFPSSIILDKKGKIRKFDTGFNGPATGVYYSQFKREFEATIDALLKE